MGLPYYDDEPREPSLLLEEVRLWRRVEALLEETVEQLRAGRVTDTFLMDVQGLRDEAGRYAAGSWDEFEEAVQRAQTPRTTEGP